VETEGGEVVAYVGTNVEYADDLEFGKGRIAPRPFMFPAIERNKAWIKEKLKSVVKNPGSLGSEI
jgi:phage gpG-like protein